MIIRLVSALVSATHVVRMRLHLQWQRQSVEDIECQPLELGVEGEAVLVMRSLGGELSRGCGWGKRDQGTLTCRWRVHWKGQCQTLACVNAQPLFVNHDFMIFNSEHGRLSKCRAQRCQLDRRMLLRSHRSRPRTHQRHSALGPMLLRIGTTMACFSSTARDVSSQPFPSPQPSVRSAVSALRARFRPLP